MTIHAVLARPALFALLASMALAGCSSVSGYPADPLASDADLQAFLANSGPEAVKAYYAEGDPRRRLALRNQIAYSRLAAYDIEYHKFQADILKEGNIENLTGDLTVLALNGVGATTGGAATKAALAAASAGVVGANAHVSKDLFFDRTIPAILAQMGASRSAQLLVIQKSLKLDDARYPLPSALMDTLSYREAGSLPSAINLLTANAGASKTDAKEALVADKIGHVVQPIGGQAGPNTSFAFATRQASPAAPIMISSSIYRNLP